MNKPPLTITFHQIYFTGQSYAENVSIPDNEFIIILSKQYFYENNNILLPENMSMTLIYSPVLNFS